MKVNPIKNNNIQGINQKQNVSKAGITFNEIMTQKNDQQVVERLSKLLGEVKEHGKRLVDKRTVDNLYRYKKSVKKFMDEASEYGVKLEIKGGYRRGGRSRVFKIISEVDKKLLEVTDAVINEEKEQLDVLKVIGEIEGLLLNIYA